MGRVLLTVISRLFMVFVILAFIAAIACVWGYARYQSALTLSAKPIGDSLSSDQTFVFEKGSSIADLLTTIQSQQPQLSEIDKQLIQTISRFNGQALALKAGRYAWYDEQNKVSYSIQEVIEHVVAGKTEASSLTIPEGITLAELRQRVDRRQDIDHQTSDLTETEFIKLFSDQYTHPEGLFLSETYFYDFASSDTELYQRAYDDMQNVLSDLWAKRDESIALNDPYEALILASLIEKETGVDSERATISGVFQRRLEKGMRLQTDPAVIYGLGEEYQGKLFQSDLENDTPYNTYRRGGLPPTPIALVGRESLEAAMNPEAGAYLYFVADGEGGHRFAETLKAHNENVRLYRATIKQ